MVIIATSSSLKIIRTATINTNQEALDSVLKKHEVSLRLDAIPTNNLEIIQDSQGRDRVKKWIDSKFFGVKHNLSQSDANKYPIYYKNSINNRPSIFFDNADGNTKPLIKNQTSGRSLFDISSNGASSRITFFLITYRPQSDSTTRTKIFQWKDGNNKIIINIGSNIDFTFNNFSIGGTIANATIPTNLVKEPMLITITKDACPTKIFINGDNYYSANACGTNFQQIRAQINLGGSFNGYVGEIIILKNKLSDKHREEIEEILMKKWGII